ncbi:PQQ-dependent sugar dehydrogenase [Halobaculum sp. CBA1158]|uniref:PQQ-dependent sugar dehydrogenase n=1 Tax=Halobaculum sp. CBA1158 TaxID=2904243 RepID=UPI001F3AC14C|nr:PQQ-dependent sugar dehydrogenase [Halobaculum sp. CBA1158]UIO99687.1 PQQ-dependent sugar dehydrogenase [Halobaculum sp. CBA1158]
MSNDWSRRRALAVAGGALLAGCSGAPSTDGTADGDDPGDDGPGDGDPDGTPTPEPTPVPEPETEFTPEEWTAPTDAPATEVERTVLVENLEVPWDLSVASNGDVFVTERVGRVSRFAGGDVDAVFTPADAIDAGSVPADQDEQQWWVDGGEGGTLGVAVHPDYPDVEVLYVYYTANAEDGGGGDRVNRVSRFDLSADDPAATEEVVVGSIPANQYHNGGRIAFGPRGYLWITTGDAGEKPMAADPGALPGSVLRVTVNGEGAPDNPEVDGGDPRVFSYGHRNPQGIVWLPDGTPIANEHGPSGRDEVNRLVAGGDYGWPEVRTADEYRGLETDSAVRRPLVNTQKSTWAPTGSLFYTGDGLPSWSNRMVIGGLRSQQVIVATLSPPDAERPPLGDRGRRFDAGWLDDAYTVTAHPRLTDVLGRVRHVEQGVDGELYAITSNRDGRSASDDGFPRSNDDVLVRLEGAR